MLQDALREFTAPPSDEPVTPAFTTVPVIDLAPFTDGTPGDRAAVAQAVNAACTDIGFFAIAGHRVPDPWSHAGRPRAFFDLPAADKRR